MKYSKGDRVSYTVMYGGTPSSHYERTEYGKVTRVQPGGARGEPQATIAVENPVPGAARYVKRYVTDIAPAPVAGAEATTVTYTREQVHAVINEAANLTGELVNPSGYESSESIAADSAMDMVVNLATYFLDHPGATGDEAIAVQWADEREDDETDAELVERVKGWLLG